MTLSTSRMRRWARLAMTCFLLPLAAGTLAAPAARAQAEATNPEAKIIVHVASTAGGRPCTSAKGRARCDEMKVNASLGAYYYAYVCVVDGKADVGIAGAQFGVNFRRAKNVGVDISEWTNCATLQFPFPQSRTDWYNASNGGNLVTFNTADNCQRTEPSGAGTGVTAVLGYFYLTSYSPDRLEITVRPNDGWAKVADCGSSERGAYETIVAGPGAPFRTKSYLGFVEFSDGGTVPGSNPCGLSKPVVETTWTGVKNSGR